MQAGALDPALALTLRAALALLLLGAAFAKLRRFAAFRAAVAGYRLLPERGVGAAALGLLAAELSLGAMLLMPTLGAPAALGAAALLLLYAGAMAVNLARGRRDVDCGCTGPGARRPIGWELVARNLLLAGVALGAALWLDGVSVVAGAAVLALLYATLDASLALGPVRREAGGGPWSTR
jgi:uncharacterized membrane protein YphA (DoxX/SURF4 family)